MRFEARSKRILEMVPGAAVWSTFLLGIILSFTNPLFVIAAIILFDLYWLFRVLYFVIFIAVAWKAYSEARRTNWFANLERDFPTYTDMVHVVFLPMYKEGLAIVEQTFEALLASRYPSDRFIVVLAGEERALDHFQNIAEHIRTRYEKKFLKLLVTIHPKDLPGEIASKGANINYAGTCVKKLIDEMGIAYENVIVSTFDIDTVAHPDYFACLTHTYLSHPNPTRSSYQPVVLYNNNIWESSAPMRLAAFSTTFWLMTELARPDRLFTFSSHSMSFRALVDVGFWQKDIISEDSRIFLQCFMRYNGDYQVTPLYVPLSMDTVQAENVRKSLVNLYKQQRRWAWGVEHFPYMVIAFINNRAIPLRKKIKFLCIQMEGMYTWASAPILILILGRLPLIVAPEHVKSTVLASNAPFILETLLNLSMVGILVIGLLSFSLLPDPPKAVHRHRFLGMVLQWLLLPISIIMFSAFPAIDAQTRLMLGKYLQFQVTEKRRHGAVPSPTL